MSLLAVPKDVAFMIFERAVIPKNDEAIKRIKQVRTKVYHEKKAYYGIHPVTAQYRWVRQLIMTCRKLRDWGEEFRARTPIWSNVLRIEIHHTVQMTKHKKCVKQAKRKKKRNEILPWFEARTAMIGDIKSQFSKQASYTLYENNTMYKGKPYFIAKLQKNDRYNGIRVKELILNRSKPTISELSPFSFRKEYLVTWMLNDKEIIFSIIRS